MIIYTECFSPSPFCHMQLQMQLRRQCGVLCNHKSEWCVLNLLGPLPVHPLHSAQHLPIGGPNPSLELQFWLARCRGPPVSIAVRREDSPGTPQQRRHYSYRVQSHRLSRMGMQIGPASSALATAGPFAFSPEPPSFASRTNPSQDRGPHAISSTSLLGPTLAVLRQESRRRVAEESRLKKKKKLSTIAEDVGRGGDDGKKKSKMEREKK